MRFIQCIDEARHVVEEGKIIAYPTEAVYGLGCNPFDQHAVERLASLKQRALTKGLILLISDWAQLEELISPCAPAILEPIKATWPGPVTWVFPCSDTLPAWVTGGRKTVAIRMSAHPVARALSQGGPLVSTSANLSGQEPARSVEQLQAQFPQGIEAVVQGTLGQKIKPTAIYDALTGRQLRSDC